MPHKFSNSLQHDAMLQQPLSQRHACPLPNPPSPRLELLYALRLRERRQVLGIATDDAELAGEACGAC